MLFCLKNAYLIVFEVAVLNLVESERSKPSAWIPFAWLPIYESRLAPKRPDQGYHGHPARRIRLEHQALAHVLADWDARTQSTFHWHWGGSVLRKSKLYLAAVVVDHQQLDKFAGCCKYLYVLKDSIL